MNGKINIMSELHELKYDEYYERIKPVLHMLDNCTSGKINYIGVMTYYQYIIPGLDGGLTIMVEHTDANKTTIKSCTIYFIHIFPIHFNSEAEMLDFISSERIKSLYELNMEYCYKLSVLKSNYINLTALLTL